MNVIGWWRQRMQKAEAARLARLQALLALYPDDDPFIVSALLNPMPAIRYAASEALAKHRKLRAQEMSLRMVIREELVRFHHDPR